MGEIIDMQQYRLRKAANKLLESQGRRHGMKTAAELLREKRAAEGRELHEATPKITFLNTTEHPAGRGLKGRHE